MKVSEMLRHVDHTKLQAFTAWQDIVKLCEEAIRFRTASVCIPPAYIRRVHETYGDKLNICTVVGFPLGYSATAAKAAEIEQALKDGCNEIDMVINISDVKNGDYDKVKAEIATLKKCCGQHVLKVIVETCYLTEEEKIAMCRAVTEAGADYIKTSTGFGTGGATKEDVELFKKHIGPNVKIKAAGGVSSLDDLAMFLELGCDRVGTSKAVALCEEMDLEAEYGKY
ncbi:MAG: deoxyribose-phosphate aldolase [Lachnospiraceae bacterium]|nr:deoxyribose-phosphate aldolase [Lachnospiraceae bacterium]